jgi:hypothetical protein
LNAFKETEEYGGTEEAAQEAFVQGSGPSFSTSPTPVTLDQHSDFPVLTSTANPMTNMDRVPTQPFRPNPLLEGNAGGDHDGESDTTDDSGSEGVSDLDDDGASSEGKTESDSDDDDVEEADRGGRVSSFGTMAPESYGF